MNRPPSYTAQSRSPPLFHLQTHDHLKDHLFELRAHFHLFSHVVAHHHALAHPHNDRPPSSRDHYSSASSRARERSRVRCTVGTVIAPKILVTADNMTRIVAALPPGMSNMAQEILDDRSARPASERTSSAAPAPPLRLTPGPGDAATLLNTTPDTISTDYPSASFHQYGRSSTSDPFCC